MLTTGAYRLGRYEEALQWAVEVAALQPDGTPSAAYLTVRAACLVRLGRYLEALELIEVGPSSPRSLFWKACAALGTGRSEEAATAHRDYVGLCGPDILGDKLMRKITAETERNRSDLPAIGAEIDGPNTER